MKASRIVLPEAPEASQLNLFPATGVTPLESIDYDPFPATRSGTVDVLSILANSRILDKVIGLDFEFNPKTQKPSILGIANRAPLTAALSWDVDLAVHIVRFCVENNVKIVGHSSIATEKALLEENIGVTLPLSLFEDTLIEHYLLNQDFCKTTEKEEDEGSLGFMNLWCMASMTTKLPQWKICRGRACEGPCPKHDVWGYCAIDAYASVEGHVVMQQEMKKWGVPYSFYRELIELADICYNMEKRGLRVDLQYIDKLNAEMDAEKNNLFPAESAEFNPRSAKQIISWFGNYGVRLKTTDKKYLQKVLEKQGVKSGHGDFKEYLDFLETNPPTEAPWKELYDLYTFKSSGKGCDPWFGEKYRDGDFIHPRFIVTGTCTGRLASSRPNFTNIPTRGWGTAIKKAIIPRDESQEFLKVDASQLELRTVLYLSGVDPSIIGADAFTWMVGKGEGKFEKATQYMGNFTPRDVAKSVSYGSLYGEGIKLLSPSDLSTARIKREISDGCLRVYEDWTFRGNTVAFTGANLAERFFGSRTDANRRKALEIQEDLYFAQFPMLRTWHKRTLAFVEDHGYITSPCGRFLRLYGEDVDDAKMAFSFLGQGCGADHIQAIMLVYKRERDIIPDLMVHDELLFPIDKGWSDKQCKEFLVPMFSETFRFPGLSVPGQPKRGPTYGSMVPLT